MALNPFGTIGNPLKKKLNPLAQENVPVGQGPIANTSVGSNFLENLQRSNEELKMKIEQDVQPEEAPTFDIKPAYDWKTAPSPFTKENAPTQTGALSGQGVTQGAEPLQMTQGVEPPVIASMEGRKNIPKGSIMDTVVPKANAGENIDTNLSQQAISDIHAGMPIEELSKEYPELAMSKGLFEQYASDVKAGMPQSEGAKMYPELFGKPAVTEAPKEEEGFFDKIGQFAEERGTKALDLQSKDFSDVTKGAGALGEGLGFIGDVVFESLSRMTPDVVKETIKSGAKGAWESIPQSVQNLSVASLKAGGETWKSFEQEYPETARNITSALQIGSAIPIGKGAQVTGKGVVKGLEKTGEVFGKTGEVIGDIGKKTGEVVTAPFKSIINTTKKYAGTPEEVSGIQSAIKPKQRVKNGVLQRSQDQINNEIKLTNGLIRESGEAPVDLATYKDSIKKQMENVGSEINRLTGQDLTVDLTPTAGKIRQIANSREVQLLDPAESGKLLRMADDIEKNGRMKLQDAEAMNQFINDTLKSTTSSASEAYKRGLQILVGDIRQGLDDTISNIPGQFKDIKKTYGALRNVYGDTVAREIVYNRQNMGGLIDSIGAIEGSGNIISGGMKILTGSPGAGLADIGKGITQNAVGRFIKSKNDPNNIIRSIFQKSGEKRSIPDVKNKPKVIPLLPAGKPMTGYAPGKIKATSEALSGKVGERPGTVAKLEDKQGLIKQQQSLLNKDKKLQSDAQEINKLFDNVRGRGTPDVVDRLVLKMEGLFGEDKISIPDAEKILKLSKTKLADDVMDRVYSKLDEKGYTINNDGFIEKVKPTIIPKSKPIQSIPEAKPTQVPTIPKTIETTPTAKKTGIIDKENQNIADDKYLYHGTSTYGFNKIKEEGIKPQRRGLSSLSTTEEYSKNWAFPEATGTKGEMLRIKKDFMKGKIFNTSKQRVKTDEMYEILTKETIPPEAIEVFKDGKWQPLVNKPKPSIISPVKSKSTERLKEGKKTILKGVMKELETPAPKIIGLTEKGGVKNILPGNQVKYNQGVKYEPVRLVLSDKDAQIARYGAIRNKALTRPRKESEKLEIESIIRSTKMTPEEINIRAQEIKDIAKKARSKSESVLVDLRNK